MRRAVRSGKQVETLTRDDLEEVVGTEVESVLDVGCGAGALGAALKRRGVRRVVGIEINPATAADAAGALDEVLTCDVEREPLPFPDGSFDCIVYGDILEHLVDPWAVLRLHRRLVREGGRIVISTPNVAHWRIVAGLVRGRFDYQRAGPLDATHLRFFTLRSLRDLCEQAGFRVSRVHPFLPPGKARLLSLLTGGRLEHLLVWRYVVEAVPAPAEES